MSKKKTLFNSFLLILAAAVLSVESLEAKRASVKPPPLETFYLEPIELENISIWVPAVKDPPVINRACMPKKNLKTNIFLPDRIRHTKSPGCPNEVARLLAEYTAGYYKQDIPLTIFNGWQWDYHFSLSGYKTFSYDLPARGGAWENCMEAVLTQSIGLGSINSFKVPSLKKLSKGSDNNELNIEICVQIFSSVKTRDGYPKKRKF